MTEATDNEEGGDSTQIKCPCCGEMISMSASKADSTEGGDQGGADWEQGFRESMSPRNDEQPTT